MILNFNVTGRETNDQLGSIVKEAFLTFQEDVNHTDGKVARNTQLVYSTLGVHLISAFLTNEAMNNSDMNVEMARIFVKTELMPILEENINHVVENMFCQIGEGRAKFNKALN